MSKLKQDQEFTDKSGNLYKIYDCRLCIKALGIWNELKFDLKGVTILVNEGELIPVKPKTIGDEMMDWLLEMETRTDLLSIPHIKNELKKMIKKHKE